MPAVSPMLPVKLAGGVVCTRLYNSPKLLLVLIYAVRSGSPVPSLGAVPTLITCCAILDLDLFEYLWQFLFNLYTS